MVTPPAAVAEGYPVQLGAAAIQPLGRLEREDAVVQEAAGAAGQEPALCTGPGCLSPLNSFFLSYSPCCWPRARPLFDSLPACDSMPCDSSHSLPSAMD